MGHGSSVDYARRAKQGFLAGAGLFLAGVAGEFLSRQFLGGVSGWQAALLFDAEVVGILVALLGPLLFAVVLPLVE